MVLVENEVVNLGIQIVLRVFLKLDLEIVYDNLKRKVVDSIMLQIGFGEKRRK